MGTFAWDLAIFLARPLLIIIITTMVLISMHPFPARKILLLAVALLGFSAALCLADPLFMAEHSAPSQDRGRSAIPVAQPQQKTGPYSANLRSVACPDVKNGNDTRSPVFGDLELVQAGFQVDQYLARKIFAPFSQMPVCVRSDAGLTLALSAVETGEGSGF